jgi:hypothetical protein
LIVSCASERRVMTRIVDDRMLSLMVRKKDEFPRSGWRCRRHAAGIGT